MTIKLEIAGYLGWWGDSRVLAAVSDTTCHHAIAPVIYWHRLMHPDTGNTSPATNYTDQGRCLLIVLGTSWRGQPGLGWVGPVWSWWETECIFRILLFSLLEACWEGLSKKCLFLLLDKQNNLSFILSTNTTFHIVTGSMVKWTSIVQHGHDDCS